MLYNITASRGTRQIFCVRAVPPTGIVGHWTGEEILTPDTTALREALPHYWRKALDRSSGNFWFDRANNECCHLTLHFPRADSVTLVATLQV